MDFKLVFLWFFFCVACLTFQGRGVNRYGLRWLGRFLIFLLIAFVCFFVSFSEIIGFLRPKAPSYSIGPVKDGRFSISVHNDFNGKDLVVDVPGCFKRYVRAGGGYLKITGEWDFSGSGDLFRCPNESSGGGDYISVITYRDLPLGEFLFSSKLASVGGGGKYKSYFDKSSGRMVYQFLGRDGKKVYAAYSQSRNNIDMLRSVADGFEVNVSALWRKDDFKEIAEKDSKILDYINFITK